MRKLLLATAAVIGGSLALAGTAHAQWAANSFTVPAGQPAVSGPGFGTATPGPGAPLAPATMTVHINGRFAFYFGGAWDNGKDMGAYKANTWGIQQYARLYPSFDAMAANGLQYGAFLEIRQGTGAVATAAPSGAANKRGALWLYEEYGYFGTPQLGYLRIGSGNQPTSLLLTGTFENFNDGGWDGDIGGLLSGNMGIDWSFPDSDSLQITNKFVYLSPQFFNMVDFGVAFMPGTANEGSNGNCPVAKLGCDLLSSGADLGSAARPRNEFDGAVRLQTAYGPIGIAADVGYNHSGRVNYTGGGQPFKDQNFIDGGLQLTYGGLAVGGHVTYGDFTPGYNGLPVKGARKSDAWVVGASYAFGPAIVGASYLNEQFAGAWSQANSGLVARSENEDGVAAGGTLNVAPGAVLFLSYLYGQKHQLGYNYVTGNVGDPHNNYVRSQAVAVGTMLRW